MNPWLETIGVIIISAAGVCLGRAFSRLKNPYWLLGYFLSLVLIIMMAVTRFSSVLNFTPPFSWLIAGRTRFVTLAIAATIGVTTPLSRLPRKFEKVTAVFLMLMVVTWFSVLPFLTPALIKNKLLNTKTLIDINGICFQTTDYTCGPAAAVTALAKLGLHADEGHIAVLAHTSPVAGTLPHCLSSALQNHYANQGLNCRYQRFDSIERLKNAGITLAVVSDSLLLNHCVAVLDVSEKMVTIADPVFGKTSMSHDHFKKIWRFAGIVLKRENNQSI